MSLRTKALIGVLLAAVACGRSEPTTPTDTNTNTGSTGPTGSTGNTGPSGSTSSSIAIADNSFTPAATTISAGTTVTWTWTGFGTHNVTFNSVSITGSGNKTSGTFSKQFPTAGTFGYQCTNHPSMTGTITVQ